MYCSNCGEKIDRDSIFCEFCGEKIKEGNIKKKNNKKLENENEEIFEYLTKKEQKKLKVLDDTRIKSFSSAWNPLASSLFSSKISKTHKKMIIGLRVKARIRKEGLNENKDKESILKIRKEEEERIKNRF